MIRVERNQLPAIHFQAEQSIRRLNSLSPIFRLPANLPDYLLPHRELFHGILPGISFRCISRRPDYHQE